MNTETAPQVSNDVLHHGRNVKRLREIMGIKQEVLADRLRVSQQTISRLESQEELDNEILNKIAKVLKIPVDAIKSYNDEMAVNIISNTFNEQSVAYQYNANPINKIMQLYEEKIKLYEEKILLYEERINLYEEKIELYERLLKAEQDKNSFFERKPEVLK